MLNTASNLGGTWPGFFVLRGIDYFTVATCKVKEQGSEVLIKGNAPRADPEIDQTTDRSFVASECVSDRGKGECRALGGECVTERDGYYIVSTICIIAGIIIFITFIRPTALALQGMAMCWLPTHFVRLIACSPQLFQYRSGASVSTPGEIYFIWSSFRSLHLLYCPSTPLPDLLSCCWRAGSFRRILFNIQLFPLAN